eukprot:12120945-Alexandrium_andersonii.AAC.1
MLASLEPQRMRPTAMWRTPQHLPWPVEVQLLPWWTCRCGMPAAPTSPRSSVCGVIRRSVAL